MSREPRKAFLEIKWMSEEEQEALLRKLEQRIEEKKKQGLLTEREIQEIEHMRLRPLPDIQDVQSVYQDILFRAEEGSVHRRDTDER